MNNKKLIELFEGQKEVFEDILTNLEYELELNKVNTITALEVEKMLENFDFTEFVRYNIFHKYTVKNIKDSYHLMNSNCNRTNVKNVIECLQLLILDYIDTIKVLKDIQKTIIISQEKAKNELEQAKNKAIEDKKKNQEKYKKMNEAINEKMQGKKLLNDIFNSIGQSEKTEKIEPKKIEKTEKIEPKKIEKTEKTVKKSTEKTEKTVKKLSKKEKMVKKLQSMIKEYVKAGGQKELVEGIDYKSLSTKKINQCIKDLYKINTNTINIKFNH